MTYFSSLMPFARTFIEIIALILNPNKAIIVVFPAWNPIHGGNIRFPEPKNIENNAIESNTVSFADNFFIIFPFFVFCVTAKVLSPGSAEPTGTDVTGRRCRLSFCTRGNRAWLVYFPLAFPEGENIRFWRRLRRGDVKFSEKRFWPQRLSCLRPESYFGPREFHSAYSNSFRTSS